MDEIIVKNLLLRGIIGINPDERTKIQDILLNMIVYTDIRAAAAGDDIKKSVNYKSITKRIIKHVEASSNFLVEALASDIARIILSEFNVEKVFVSVEKPGALRFAESVGVRIVRVRADFNLD